MIHTQVIPTTASRLESLCAELAHITIPLEEVNRRFFERNTQYPKDLGAITGALAEWHTLLALEEIARHDRAIKIFYLKHKTRKGCYKFFPNRKIPTSIKIRQGFTHHKGEIDLIFLLEENTPVIVETHISRYNHSSDSVTEKVLPKNVQEKTGPVSRLFERNPFIVYIIPHDQVQFKDIPTTNLHRFLANGGLVVPFPYERREWRKMVKSLVESKMRRIVYDKRMTDVPENGYTVPLAV